MNPRRWWDAIPQTWRLVAIELALIAFAVWVLLTWGPGEFGSNP